MRFLILGATIANQQCYDRNLTQIYFLNEKFLACLSLKLICINNQRQLMFACSFLNLN